MTIIASPIASGLPDLLIVRSPSGSHPWYAVRWTGPGTDAHITRAVWLDSGVRRVGDVTTDGLVRFFRTKRELLALLATLTGKRT